MKKKLLSVLLAGCMVLSLAACGNDGGSATPDAGQTQPDTQTQTPAADKTENSTEGGIPRILAKLRLIRQTVR